MKSHRQSIWHRSSCMVKDWRVWHEERLKVLGLFSLKTRLKGDVTDVHKCLVLGLKKIEPDSSPWYPKTRDDGNALKYRRFHLNIKPPSVVLWEWQNTGAGCPEYLSFKVFKTQVDSPEPPAVADPAWEELGLDDGL